MAHRTTDQGMKAFWIIWFGQLISLTGAGLTSFSLGVWVYSNTGSATLFALITLFGTLPGILISPLAGALIDRWNRRDVMIGSEIGAAIATSVIVLLLWSDQLEIWHIYVGTGAISVFTAFQRTAWTAATTMLVQEENYTRASGMVQAATGAQYILSPVLSGALLVFMPIHGIILADLISYLVALGTLAIVTIPRPPVSTETAAGAGSLLHEIAFAWHYLTARPGLLGLLLMVAVGNFMVGFLAVLASPMMLAFTSPTMLGTTMSIAGTGMLIGSIAVGVWGGPKRLVRGVIGFMALGGLGIVLMGVRPNVIIITAACFAFFFSVPFVNGCYETIWRKKIVADMQGRMFGFTRAAVMSVTTLAYLIAGPLADYVFEPMLAVDGPLESSLGQLIGVGPGRGIGLLLIVAGLLSIAVAVAGSLYPHLWQLETELPDVVIERTPETQQLTSAVV